LFLVFIEYLVHTEVHVEESDSDHSEVAEVQDQLD